MSSFYFQSNTSKLLYVQHLCYQLSAIPVLYYLLSDHFDVFKALHTADVIHQDVSVGIANSSAAQIQPFLKGQIWTERHENTQKKVRPRPVPVKLKR